MNRENRQRQLLEKGNSEFLHTFPQDHQVRGITCFFSPEHSTVQALVNVTSATKPHRISSVFSDSAKIPLGPHCSALFPILLSIAHAYCQITLLGAQHCIETTLIKVMVHQPRMNEFQMSFLYRQSRPTAFLVLTILSIPHSIKNVLISNPPQMLFPLAWSTSHVLAIPFYQKSHTFFNKRDKRWGQQRPARTEQPGSPGCELWKWFAIPTKAEHAHAF